MVCDLRSGESVGGVGVEHAPEDILEFGEEGGVAGLVEVEETGRVAGADLLRGVALEGQFAQQAESGLTYRK